MFDYASWRLRWKGNVSNPNPTRTQPIFQKEDGERTGLLANDELELDYKTYTVDEGVDLYPKFDAEKAPAVHKKNPPQGGQMLLSSDDDESPDEYS